MFVPSRRLLTLKEVDKYVKTCGRRVVKRRNSIEPEEGMIAKYLSGWLEGSLARETGDVSSVWTQERNKHLSQAK